VLDFRYVSGVDSAAATCFVKIRGLINTQRVKLFFSHVSPEVERALRRADIIFDDNLTTTLEVDIDHAVEQAEEMLLSEAPELDAGTHLVNHLVAAIGAYPRLADLIAVMSCMSMQAEEVLIRAGDDADDVFFVAHGRVRVQVTLPDGRVIRLQTITSGAIVGEIALYLRRKRTADVIVEIPSEIFRLSATDLARLEREDAELAVLAHRLLASNLSEKLAMANRMIQLAQR
jgi:SulP family sulfate permease